jgi:hypothetical protein
MTILEELERKVLQVIEKNKKLTDKIDAIIKENDKLKNQNQNQKLESTLIKDNIALNSLEIEKENIINLIKSLLESINKLENAV